MAGVGRSAAPRSLALWRYGVSAALGLGPQRVAARAERSPWRTRSASSFEAPLPAADPLQFGRAYQLPPFGRGNSLDALFWTPVARLAADRVDAVLAALEAEDVPAWAAPVRTRARRSADDPHDLWVASGRSDEGQDVLLRVLNA